MNFSFANPVPTKIYKALNKLSSLKIRLSSAPLLLISKAVLKAKIKRCWKKSKC